MLQDTLEDHPPRAGAAATAASPPALSAPRPVLSLHARPAEIANRRMRASGCRPAWLPGTDVALHVVPAGTRYRMVLTGEQASSIARGLPAFGCWATPGPVPSQAFARDRLAILTEFKADVSWVATVETLAPHTVNHGYAAPLDEAAGAGLQVEFVGEIRLRVVGEIEPLPPE